MAISGPLWDWSLRVTGCALAAVAAAAYLHGPGARARPGAARLVLSLPVVALFAVMPYAFPLQTASRASAAAMFTWLANFKLLAWALGRGPAAQPGLTLGQFAAILLWPTTPLTDKEGRIQFISGPRGRRALLRLVWRFPENAAVFLLGLYTLTHPAVPLFVKTYSAAFGVCAYCGLWANACAALIMWVHGLEVGPSWDRPWLQSSLSDFWARRWNLPASASLKHLVYDPIVEGSLVARRRPAPQASSPGSAPGAPPAATTAESIPAAASAAAPAGPSDPSPEARKPHSDTDTNTQEEQQPLKAAGVEDSSGTALLPPRRRSPPAAVRALGLLATFAVSGLMHEALLIICTGSWAQLGRQMVFFGLQVPLMLVEQQLVKFMRAKRLQAPLLLAIPVASLTLQIPAMYFFWGAYFDTVTPRSSPLAAPTNLLGAAGGAGAATAAGGPAWTDLAATAAAAAAKGEL